ncbi:MAG: hypothetical protein JXA60_04115 [Candidatus Coatesbacteria bacterium]|nr:hypothetical protein [Candidatus Coatesbacteria bacterium]
MRPKQRFTKTYKLQEGISGTLQNIYLVPEITNIKRIEILKTEWLILQQIIDKFEGKITKILPSEEG